MSTRSLVVFLAICSSCTDDRELSIPSSSVTPPVVSCNPGEVARIGALRFRSVQGALNQALPGSVITVCPGVHPGGLEFPSGGSIELRGATGDPHDVVFDGQGVNQLLRQQTQGNITRLRSLTFRNGYAAWDPLRVLASGGIQVTGARLLEILDCVFEDNTGEGGPVDSAVFVESDVVRIQGTSFRRNSGNVNFHIVPPWVSPLSLTIMDSAFEDETGPMVLVEDTPSPSATIAIRRTTFTGGMGDPLTFDVHPHLDLTIEDVDISDVDARESGIVILADEGRAILRRVSIGAVGADSSPAMFIDGGSIPFAPPPRRPSFLTIEDSVIAGNTFITDVNDVIRTDPAWWAMGFHNVDFGTGPDANQPHDFVNCPDYSGIQSGYMTVNHPCL